MSPPEFYTYLHCRPDGIPFYVGKGVLKRAREFSPSRRTVHHKNIVNKYGRDQIRVCLFRCADEEDAFLTERTLIKELREQGFPLINRTEGGEGRYGVKASAAQLIGLAKGRGKGHFTNMCPGSKQRILDGLARGRAKLMESPKFLDHLKRLQVLGSEAVHRERTITCRECGRVKITRSAKAKCCSRLCEQRGRRARDKEAYERN